MVGISLSAVLILQLTHAWSLIQSSAQHVFVTIDAARALSAAQNVLIQDMVSAGHFGCRHFDWHYPVQTHNPTIRLLQSAGGLLVGAEDLTWIEVTEIAEIDFINHRTIQLKTSIDLKSDEKWFIADCYRSSELTILNPPGQAQRLSLREPIEGYTSSARLIKASIISLFVSDKTLYRKVDAQPARAICSPIDAMTISDTSLNKTIYLRSGRYEWTLDRAGRRVGQGDAKK
jgi:hypothetical protein